MKIKVDKDAESGNMVPNEGKRAYMLRVSEASTVRHLGGAGM
ncbi:hypothetical protein [Pseudomonas phage PPAT]|nr:hypothetical protein [Pseudomonas phage PPAT]